MRPSIPPAPAALALAPALARARFTSSACSIASVTAAVNALAMLRPTPQDQGALLGETGGLVVIGATP